MALCGADVAHQPADKALKTMAIKFVEYQLPVSSSGQLILPEALKLLPLYTLALIKSVGLSTDSRIDDRSFWINYVFPLSANWQFHLCTLA
ncbi:hypothetical protein M8C21_010492 [Ambrosia artemisiifolia]|uniref:Sec23/Sec24 helical domain-containing protein n=1 Tax=Ambrosia artemisiifolia TaxID=4212 RepID=A0AAD5BLW1_AMBAR|nr:hypothetical protein M8C21_010492 [Ambrosia artemisiifolia]